MNNRNYTIYQKNGFTLLEVMIAMVIFAVGMLGLAGIQALSLEGSHSSYSRSQAILLASEMVDRMKANYKATNYAMETATTSENAPGTVCDGVDTTITCNESQMASFDHWQWKKMVEDTLLTGKGKITYDATTKVYTVSVHWDENRTGATSTANCPPLSASELSCLELMVTLK